MNSPRASIIITNYNYARFVGEAIEGAIAQKGGGVEVIVVDDGSTDGSLAEIAQYTGIDVVAQQNGGQGSAFNAGFARSQGSIVFFLDADDVLAPDVVDRVEAAFAAPDVAKVQFRLGLIDAEGAPIAGTMPPAGVELPSGDLRRELVSFPDDIRWQPTSGNAFRASVLRSILPMPTEPYRICADYYLSNLSAVHGRTAVLDALGGSYRIHGANSDYGESISLGRVRANIERTSVTHRHLIDECERTGVSGLPDDPVAVRSVSGFVMRIISFRLAPDEHPIASDSRVRLVRDGVRAGLARFDRTIAQRVAIAAWFVAMGVAPASLVRPVAERFVTVDD